MSIYGLMIINTETGKLIYERDYTDCKFGLLKDTSKSSSLPKDPNSSFADSLNISALIYSMLKFHEASFTEDHTADNNQEAHSNQIIKISGSTDLYFEYSKFLPVVLVVFFSGLETELIADTASKLLDAFLNRYEKKALSSDTARFPFTHSDKIFLPIYEDLLVQSIKYFVLDLCNLNLYVPWIYICLLAKPKVPIVADSPQGSFLVPMESVSMTTGNKAKIMYFSCNFDL